MDEITYKDLLYRLRNEGEGYALKHYYGRKINHSDKKVVKLWKDAHDKLVELEDYLKEQIENSEE